MLGRVSLSTRPGWSSSAGARTGAPAKLRTARMGPMITPKRVQVTTNRRYTCRNPGSSSCWLMPPLYHRSPGGAEPPKTAMYLVTDQNMPFATKKPGFLRWENIELAKT